MDRQEPIWTLTWGDLQDIAASADFDIDISTLSADEKRQASEMFSDGSAWTEVCDEIISNLIAARNTLRESEKPYLSAAEYAYVQSLIQERSERER